MAGGMEGDDLQGPFQPKPFYDSIVGGTKPPGWPSFFVSMILKEVNEVASGSLATSSF